MTGRYPDIAGVPGVIRQQKPDSWGYLDPNVATLGIRSIEALPIVMKES